MDFVWGVIAGGTTSFFLTVPFYRRFVKRAVDTCIFNYEAAWLQNKRETIESERDTVARRSDYVVTEGDLLGTLPGAMTKDHLQHSPRFPAKTVDLQPDWFTLDDVTGSDDLTSQ